MKRRPFKRWCVTLGIFAMLGSLLVASVATAYSLALASSSAAMEIADAGDSMPCHKAPEPCPDCPQKSCLELGTCLVKCFQAMPGAVSEASLDIFDVDDAVPPASMRFASGSLIPPLLRPPSA